MARGHRFMGRSVGGGPLMIAFSDLRYSLSFFPAKHGHYGHALYLDGLQGW